MTTPAPLDANDWNVRLEVYRHFADATRAPAPSDLATALHMSVPEVVAALRRLEAHHQITLAPGSPNIWMAHPFSAIPTEYPVESAKGRYWANCAWDMLAIPALLGIDSHSRTRCAETGEPVDVQVQDGAFVGGEGVVHFAVGPSAFWENVGYT